MAQVIRGVFPPAKKSAPPKAQKPPASYILHIAIAFADPAIWRRIQVPGDCTLAQLHRVIQRSMGWSDSHIHQFLIGKISYEPTRCATGIREAKRFDEANYRLCALEESMRFMFTYFYDAGQGWEHQITLEEVVPPPPPLELPRLLAGQGACPPESVDDIHEYQKLLAAWQKAGGRRGNPLQALAGRDFDPGFFDLAAAQKRLLAPL